MRAGAASAELVVPLAPGASVEQSWKLNDYMSMDHPGDYEIAVTYHNDLERSPDGRRMIRGQARATARFCRRG